MLLSHPVFRVFTENTELRLKRPTVKSIFLHPSIPPTRIQQLDQVIYTNQVTPCCGHYFLPTTVHHLAPPFQFVTESA